MPDAELDAFKQIDLRQYAAAQGYEWDRRESWRGSTVMRSGADKIIIKRNTNGHYIYFSVRSDEDNGTIIDFIQHRARVNLGWVRAELRPWVGTPPSSSLPVFPELEKSSKDRLRVETEYQRMRDATASAYLESRYLSPALLSGPRFAGRVRIDAHSNAVFPHFDDAGLCGYELKNWNFTGFASGGEKGLWLSAERDDDTRLVICEGAIDALSHAVLFPCPTVRYASVGGKLNPKQPALLQAALLRVPVGATCVLAADADPEGRELSRALQEAFTAALSARPDLSLLEQVPPAPFKDWNDQLKAQKGVATAPGSSYARP
jgi:Toprim-like/Protein of unknown function (DUF3991)